MDQHEQLARELLTAKWNGHELRTPAAAAVYTDVLQRTFEDGNLAARVLDEMALMWLVLAHLWAPDEVADGDVLAATFEAVAQATREREEERAASDDEPD